MGTGASDIMAVAQPQRSSVLEGLQLPERPFDPAEGLRLSSRAAAQASLVPAIRRPRA
ncbi:MAG: hypothetical protein V4772_03655 [Pseudomonadota bacterium]